jgi:flagellin-like protein
MNKKAVSPLIATVLLVMIVVSIGAAVMVVIQGVYQEQEGTIQTQQQFIKCGVDVETKILSTGNNFRVCLENQSAAGDQNVGNFTVFIENSGIRDISDWRFRVIADNVYDQNGGYSSIDKGIVDKFTFSFNVSGDITQVVLMPQIPGSQNNPIVTCSEPNLVWDSEDIEGLDDCNDVTWTS